MVDEIFLRTHRGYGTPIVLQGLWRTADRVDRRLLEQVHAALRTGPLGRRVIRPSVPGARPRWRRTIRAHPLTVEDRPIPASALLTWADTCGDDLDPEFGPGWRLAAVPLDDGGSAVSLTCSHALADGRALVIAIDEALRAEPDRHAVALTAGSDWADAGGQWAMVLHGVARALPRGIPPRPAAPPRRPAASGPPVGIVVQFPVRECDGAAAALGGTSNSLFIWLVASILWAAGFPEPTIEASLPVDTRDEPRVDNDLAMTQTALTRADTPASIREKARTAYEHRMTAPGGMPEQILQVLPDRWSAVLAAGAGERDILCSNIGALPDTLTALGPHRRTGVAARAIHPGLTTLPRTRLSGYLCRSGDNYALSLVALDPGRIPTPATLRKLVSEVTSPIGVPLEFW